MRVARGQVEAAGVGVPVLLATCWVFMRIDQILAARLSPRTADNSAKHKPRQVVPLE